MDRIKGFFPHLGFAAVMAGALLSRDACFGGPKRPPPEPAPTQTAAAPAAPPQTAAPTSTQSFAAPP
jgi:hypothetical protein